MEQPRPFDHENIWDALQYLGLQGIWLRGVYEERGKFADGVRMGLLGAANKLHGLETRIAALGQQRH